MITAGMDVGNHMVKVVILKDGRTLAHSLGRTGADMRAAVDRVLRAALDSAGLSLDDIQHVKATGAGKKDAPYAHDVSTEVLCDAKGATWLCPSVRTIIDVGAEESRVIRCDVGGKVPKFAQNDKCAAGVGVFIESMSGALETSIEEMGELSLLAQEKVPLNVYCVVFAESEVVSLIHSGTRKADIARAIHDAVAARTVSLVRRIGLEREIALIGGVAGNIGIVASLKKELGFDPIIPENHQFVGALGAALLAHEEEIEEERQR